MFARNREWIPIDAFTLCAMTSLPANVLSHKW